MTLSFVCHRDQGAQKQREMQTGKKDNCQQNFYRRCSQCFVAHTMLSYKTDCNLQIMIFDYVFVQKTKPLSQETEVQGSQVYLSVNRDSCLEKGFLETCAAHILLKVVLCFLFHVCVVCCSSKRPKSTKCHQKSNQNKTLSFSDYSKLEIEIWTSWGSGGWEEDWYPSHICIVNIQKPKI